MQLPDPNDPPPAPPGPDLDLPSDRARMYATFVILLFAMIGFAFVIAALLRAL